MDETSEATVRLNFVAVVLFFLALAQLLSIAFGSVGAIEASPFEPSQYRMINELLCRFGVLLGLSAITHGLATIVK